MDLIQFFREYLKLATSKTKRWDGRVDALPVDYLKGVQEKMKDYGDRVQFSRCSGPLPNYQLINSFDKKMAFDRNHHLLRAHEEEFSVANVTSVFSMEQVTAMVSGMYRAEGSKAKPVRAVRASNTPPRATAKQLEDRLATERYEYFRTHRATLPPTIREYSDEITQLMQQGKSAEEAFNTIIQQHFAT